MDEDIDLWLERLTALRKSAMRKAANSEGLRLVHLEILHYLSVSNKYSNTAQALCEFLGQTKGSISQSLSFLELEFYIEKKEDEQDKRCTRLFLTDKGKDALARATKKMKPSLFEKAENAKWADSLKSMIKALQEKSGDKGFGQCHSCHYNRTLPNGKFQCGLTGDPLTKTDTSKLCREHEF